MLSRNEKQILNIIKFIPPIFILAISLIIIIFLYLDKQSIFEKEKMFIKSQYIKTNKELIKNEIDNLYDFTIKTQNETEENLKKQLKSRVYEAYTIASNIYNENKDLKSKTEIEKMIKDALVDIRFNDNRGYYFIYSFDYKCILFPINRNLEGTDFYNFKDGEGIYLTREIISQLKLQKEGFMTWWFSKPDDMETSYKKIGFNIYFEPMNWFIGTGEYLVDFEKSVQNDVLEYIKKLNNNEDNHYFIIDKNKQILFHLNKNYINSAYKELDFFNDKENIVEDVIKIGKENNSFISYIPKNNHNMGIGATKTIYAKYLDKWDWTIGKVFYQKNIDELFKNKEKELNENFLNNISNIILIAFFITILLLIFSRYTSILLEKKFAAYKDEIDDFMKEKTKQEQIISQQAKMAAMGEMLGNIAHQWRQPLSVISTISSGTRLQSELGDIDKEALNKSLDQITQTTLYLSGTIDDFRNFYKSDKSEQNFSVANIIEKVLKLVEIQLKNHNIILVKNIEDFYIYGLENEFLQALINIINNSKDALDSKKESEEKYIFIKTYKMHTKKIIEFYDNANGVEKELLNRLCEPYFTTKDGSKGTGIGLYMTSEIIVKHMKGNLYLENFSFMHKNSKHRGLRTIIEFETN